LHLHLKIYSEFKNYIKNYIHNLKFIYIIQNYSQNLKIINIIQNYHYYYIYIKAACLAQWPSGPRQLYYFEPFDCKSTESAPPPIESSPYADKWVQGLENKLYHSVMSRKIGPKVDPLRTSERWLGALPWVELFF
jgi:hypothetical protein